jgi:hypothetical protein
MWHSFPSPPTVAIIESDVESVHLTVTRGEHEDGRILTSLTRTVVEPWEIAARRTTNDEPVHVKSLAMTITTRA